jgi:hypothetical protein
MATYNVQNEAKCCEVIKKNAYEILTESIMERCSQLNKTITRLENQLKPIIKSYPESPKDEKCCEIKKECYSHFERFIADINDDLERMDNKIIQIITNSAI